MDSAADHNSKRTRLLRRRKRKSRRLHLLLSHRPWTLPLPLGRIVCRTFLPTTNTGALKRLPIGGTGETAAY